MSVESDLLTLKRKITTASAEQSKLEGRKEQLLSQLKEKFKVPTTEKAEKLLTKMKTELGNMQGRLNSGLDKFDEDYGEALNEF